VKVVIGSREKLAETDSGFRRTSTEHAPEPEHAPPQPSNDQPASGEALSVTTAVKSREHVGGQLMPAGLLVTCPKPLTETLRVAVGAARSGVAKRPSASPTSATRRTRLPQPAPVALPMLEV